MRLSPACRQLLIGMSIRRYLPPSGTAGFDRIWVSGKSLVPRPPPRISVSTSFMALILIADVVSYLADLQDFTAAWLRQRYQFTRCLHPRGPAWSKNHSYSILRRTS